MEPNELVQHLHWAESGKLRLRNQEMDRAAIQ